MAMHPVVKEYNEIFPRLKVERAKINDAELEKISEQLQRLDTDLVQIYNLHRDIFVSPTCQVSIAELLQAQIDSTYKILAENIESILKDLAGTKTEVAIQDKENLEAMLEKINSLKREIEKTVTTFEKKNAALLQNIQVDAASQSYRDENDFITKLDQYAGVCRKISNKLELKCNIYHSNTVEAEKREKKMAERFFKKAMEKGYDLEQSSITIGGKEFDLNATYPDKSTQTQHISTAKANATTLQKASHINQRSFFRDSKEALAHFRAALSKPEQEPEPGAGRVGFK